MSTFDFLACLQTESWKRDGMDITIADIEKDIENFKKRIATEQAKLELLPVGFLSYPQHKRREKKRQDLQAEIKHVQELIAIAQEALTDQGISPG